MNGVILLLLVLCVDSGATESEAPSPPLWDVVEGPVRKLKQFCLELAKGGDESASMRCLAVVGALDPSSSRLESLRRTVTELIATPREPTPAGRAVFADLTAIVRALTSLLPSLSDADRATLATQILRLDSSVAVAHEVLGEIEVDGEWIAPEFQPLLERRDQGVVARQQAARVELEVMDGFSPLSKISHLDDELIAVHFGSTTVASRDFSRAELTRILANGHRASAYSRFLLTRVLQPMQLPEGLDLILTRDVDRYHVAIASAVEHGMESLDAVRAERAWTLFFDPRGHVVANCTLESEAVRVLFRHIWFEWMKNEGIDAPCSILAMGHLNRVCLSLCDGEVPRWGQFSISSRRIDPAEEEVSRMRLSGNRSYLARLIRNERAPSLAAVIQLPPEAIHGRFLLSATVVADYFQFRGELFGHLARISDRASLTAFEAGIGRALIDFESEWKRWMTAVEPEADLMEILRSTAKETDLQFAERMDQLRKRAGIEGAPITVDVERSRECQAHADYLASNPTASNSWPAIAEQDPARRGYRHAGALAAWRSIVTPLGRFPEASVDLLFASYYGRLPLLHPDLETIGLGDAKRRLVVDATPPLPTTTEVVTFVTWPAHGDNGIPRKGRIEYPPPVASEPNRTLGFPITLQLFGGFVDDRELRMTLFDSYDDEVPCYFTSPHTPTNPQRVIERTYALFPKAPLMASHRYRVEISGLSSPRTIEFQTGRK